MLGALLWMSAASVGLPGVGDRDAVALKRCLDAPANASTAGQANCEAVAEHAYDRRMNRAYVALIQLLPADARDRLRRAQRAWLNFRDAEAGARAALYATRSGTMYVPMQAASAAAVTRDRALQLEGALRVMAIDR